MDSFISLKISHGKGDKQRLVEDNNLLYEHKVKQLSILSTTIADSQGMLWENIQVI
jgi:hypothetical protein